MLKARERLVNGVADRVIGFVLAVLSSKPLTGDVSCPVVKSTPAWLVLAVEGVLRPPSTEANAAGQFSNRVVLGAGPRHRLVAASPAAPISPLHSFGSR